MELKKSIKKKVIKIFDQKICPQCDFMKFVPPGHIYSPIPSEANLARSQKVDHDVFEGLNFNEKKQMELLTSLSKYSNNIPEFPDNKTADKRYYYNNDYISYPDATVLICMLLHFNIKKIIDIGGGLSTALILDLNDSLFKDNPIQITVIKPDKFNVDYNNDDPNFTLIPKFIQEVDRSLFQNLQENDLVFLDTTHTVKLGSDINYIAFHLLPVLKSGVKIHIHDMYYPFEYPEEYFHEGKYWNEIYFWKAFLMYNSDFDIELFNSYFEKNHRELVNKYFPQYFKGFEREVTIQGAGSSLWIKKK